MTKKLKPTILFLIFFLLLQGAYGQIQMNVTDYLSQRFLRYCESVPREEIYVHSDREEYVAGEDLWFNVYLIDRQRLKPSLNSKIVYFELLNPENQPVVQKRIWIDEGSGPGQIVLPDSLSTGTYTIRAYTSWMKNFLPYNCYMKDIKVYNSFSTKAFKGKLSSGNIPDGETGTEINLGPNAAGLTLKVNNLKPDTLEIFVNADENYRSENSNLFYLFIQTHGIINHVSSERMSEGNIKIALPKTLLTAGINQITLFDSKGQPVCERFIYTPANEKQILTLHSVNSTNVRNRISLEIEMDNTLPASLNATNLSLSVAPFTNDPGLVNMNDYLIYGTEFGLFPWNTPQGSKISQLPPEIIDSLLLNVKSNWINWKTILSDKLPDFRYQVEKEEQHLFGKLLTPDQKAAGSDEFLLLSTPGKVPVFEYARTDYEGNFNFNIHIDEELKDLIIQPDEVTKNNKIIIESSFSDQYLQSEILVDSTNKPIPHYVSKWSVNYQVMKIYGSSFIGVPVTPVVPQLKPKRFYGKPDVELIMADYIKLPVMQEVFFELIPGVLLKNKKSVYEILIADPIDNKIYEVAPGLLIDGVIINDPSIIANLDPEIVEKIDVVKEKYFVGDYLFFGIVNVITKSGDFGCVTLPGYATRLPYRVIDPVVSFLSPDYSSAEMKNSRNPDFRNTLYWNPSIKPDKDGKARIDFWTSDITSDYEINIQGITSEGKTISFKKIIKVE
ncbi:MAG: hypothetical protein NTX93_04250 [Bacteroidia bacterium]|nr:hypothetical protein [Bacteroidia bacterium]